MQRGWLPDYMTVRRRPDLQIPKVGEEMVAPAAAKLSTMRLIDDIEF